MSTEKQVERLENATVRLTVTIDKDTVNEKYNEVVKHYAKEAQVKGFRKGKVPFEIMERKFGDSLKWEATHQLLDESLRETLEEIEEKPLPYSQPELDGEVELQKDEDFTFSVKYDVYPKIELGEYNGVEVEVDEIEITDEDMERELKNIQEQNAVVQEKSSGAVEQDDIVTIDYWELDENDEPKDDTRREDFVFTVGTGYNLYKLDDDIIGMEAGAEKVVTKEFPDDYEHSELAGQTKKVGVKIKTIKQRELPELDDELAQDVSEKYETLEDLKRDIRKRLEEAAENRMRDEKVQKILDKIVENSELELPGSMLDAELDQFWQEFVQKFQAVPEQIEQMLAAQGMTKDDFKQRWREDAEKRLSRRLVVQKILENEEIEVSDEEFDADIKEKAEASSMDLEQTREYIEQNNMTEYLRREVRERKLYDQLIERATVKPGEKVKFLDAMQRNA